TAGGLRRPAGSLRPGGAQGRQRLAGRGLDRPGNLLPAPAARHPRLRRSGGVLGPPQEQPAAQPRRAVFRLLLPRRDHGARGERRAGPRTHPAHDPVSLPPRPRPRPGPGPDRDAGARHPARRHPRRFRLLPPRRGRLGAPAPPGRGAARPGPAPARPRTEGHPRRRHYRQRQPVLPPGTPPAAGARAARPHRHQTAGRRPRPQDRRAGPVQARPPHPRRRRWLPPGAVPRRCGQDPLPAAARLHDAGPGPARDPAAPRTSPGLPRPADDHRPPAVLAPTAKTPPSPPGPGGPPPPRRTGAERGFATTKDPATNDITRGWCRLMGLAPLMLFITTLLIARNQRILTA